MALTQVSRGLLSTSIVDNGNATAITIDSSENVGIGTSPAYKLDVDGSVRLKTGSTGTPVIVSTGSDSQGTLRFGSASNEYSINSGADYLAMIFNTNDTERMRIDSSGNLLVGKSGTAFSTNGVELRPNGAIWATVTGQGAASFNIKGTDGVITDFYKDGSTVGSIGTAGGDVYLSNGTKSLLLTGSLVLPRNGTGGISDGTVDLGNSSNRFKDLYLSGAVALTTADNASAANMFVSPSTDFLYLEHPSNGMIFRNTSGSEAMRISGGNLLVGTTSAAQDSGDGVKIKKDGTQGKVFVIGSSATSGEGYSMHANGSFRFYVQYSGQINSTSQSILGISDVSLKENIRDLDRGLEEILALQPRRFDWKNGDGNDIMGFVAQEVETVLPELVHDYKYDSEETKLGLKMGDMIPTLVKAIQEQQETITALTARITQLENN